MYELFKEWLLKPKPEVKRYTEAELMSRLRFFIGICLALTLTGIVFVVLYSIIFVTQPLNVISPTDQKFFELIIPVATFLTGTLSGIMLGKENPDALKAANSGWDRAPTPIATPAPEPIKPAPIKPVGMVSTFAPAPVAVVPTTGSSMNIDDLGLGLGQSPKFTDD